MDDGFVTTAAGEDGTTTYRRSLRSIVVEQVTEILDNTSKDELTAQVSEMRERVTEFQVEHEDSEAIREWKTIRRNLAFTNAALAIAEAEQAVDDSKV